MTQPANKANAHHPGKFVAHIPSGTEITSEMVGEMYGRAIREQTADEIAAKEHEAWERDQYRVDLVDPPRPDEAHTHRTGRPIPDFMRPPVKGKTIFEEDLAGAPQKEPEFRSIRGSGQMLRGTIISNPGELVRDHRNNYFLPLELVGDGNSDDAPAIQAMHDEGARTDWRDSYTIDGTGKPLDLVIEMMGQALAVVGEYTDVSVRLSGKDLTGLHDFLAENTAAFIAFGESRDALATERTLTLYAQKEVRHLQAELATSNSRIRSITTDLKNTKAELKKAKKDIARAVEQSREADTEAKQHDAETIRALTNALDDARARTNELMYRIKSLEMAARGSGDFGFDLASQDEPPDFAIAPEADLSDFVPKRVARWAYLAIYMAMMAAAILAAQFLTF